MRSSVTPREDRSVQRTIAPSRRNIRYADVSIGQASKNSPATRESTDISAQPKPICIVDSSIASNMRSEKENHAGSQYTGAMHSFFWSGTNRILLPNYHNYFPPGGWIISIYYAFAKL